jgi:hypothetical protein
MYNPAVNPAIRLQDTIKAVFPSVFHLGLSVISLVKERQVCNRNEAGLKSRPGPEARHLSVSGSSAYMGLRVMHFGLGMPLVVPVKG